MLAPPETEKYQSLKSSIIERLCDSANIKLDRFIKLGDKKHRSTYGRCRHCQIINYLTINSTICVYTATPAAYTRNTCVHEIAYGRQNSLQNSFRSWKFFRKFSQKPTIIFLNQKSSKNSVDISKTFNHHHHCGTVSI